MSTLLMQTESENFIMGESEKLFQQPSDPFQRPIRRSPVPDQDSTTRLIPLSQGKSTIVDAADYEWLSRWKWHAKDCRCDKWYAARNDGRPQKTLRMHRVILSAPDGVEVDHINGNSLDNRRCNLRLVTRQENAENRLQNRNNKSGFRGVHWHKWTKKWLAQATIKGTRHYIGVFDDPSAASDAYREYLLRDKR